MLAPICLFTYNRLEETQQTVEALQKNYLAAESDLYIFSDGAKNESEKVKVMAVRQYLKTLSGFKTIRVFESSVNNGLADSIISGVTQIIKKHEKVIVLEDDLVTSPNFLSFMNKALDYYSLDTNVRSINGYSLSLKNDTKDIYFQKRPFSWGWATWLDKWNYDFFDKEKIRLKITQEQNILKEFGRECGDDIVKMLLDSINNKNNSWYVRWTFAHFTTNTYSVYPAYSFVENIGFSKNGTHCKGINSYQSNFINSQKKISEFISFHKPRNRETKQFLNYFSFTHKLNVRLKLLREAEGRRMVLQELIERIKK